MLLLRLSHGISSGCHHATPSPFFGIVIVSGSLALCFCFDLDKVFLHGATTTPLHQTFFGIVILGKWTLCFCFDLAKVFLQGATMPTLHQKFFFEFVIIAGRGHNASAST